MTGEELAASAAGRTRPGLWALFGIWLILGTQSFGGGSSTLLFIHRACMKYRWIDESEFVRDWALVQVAPGINLVKFTALLGYRLRGWAGLAVAIAGLLLPSATVTVLMTAGYDAVRSQPMVQAALKGILPATIGLSLAMAWQMAEPMLARSWHEGRARLSAHVLVLLASAAGLILGASPVIVLLLSGACLVLLLAAIPCGAET